MVFGNPTSQILKILSPQNLSLKLEVIKLEVFAQTFVPGQTLQGRVTQVLPQGRAVVNFDGKPVLVELEQALNAGQRLTARVEQTTPSPILKLLPPSPPPGGNRATPLGSQPPQPGVPEETLRSGVTTTFSPQALSKENRIRQNIQTSPLHVKSGAEVGTQNEPAGRLAAPVHSPDGPAPGKPVQGTTNPNPGVSQTPVQNGRSATGPRGFLDGTDEASSRPAEFKLSGAVARFANREEARPGPESIVTRPELQRLQLKPHVRSPLTVSKVEDAQTVVVRAGGRNVAVRVPQAGLFRRGDVVMVTPRPVPDGFVLEARALDQVVRSVTPQMIKPLLTASQSFGSMVSTLQKSVVEHPALKHGSISPELLGRLQETLSLFQPAQGEPPSAQRLRAAVENSGIQYEARVRNLLLAGERAGNGSRLEFDLKGQLLELATKLGEGAQKSQAGNAGSKPYQEILQTVQRAVQNIEFHQLSHQFSRQEHLAQILPIPQQFLGGGVDLKIYVRRDEEGGEESGARNKETFNLVFILDMTALGPLRIDTQVRPTGVSVSIQGENESVMEFIGTHIPELENRLQEIGFPARVTSTVRERVDRDVPDAVAEWVIHEPTRLVDIKT